MPTTRWLIAPISRAKEDKPSFDTSIKARAALRLSSASNNSAFTAAVLRSASCNACSTSGIFTSRSVSKPITYASLSSDIYPPCEQSDDPVGDTTHAWTIALHFIYNLSMQQSVQGFCESCLQVRNHASTPRCVHLPRQC